VLEHPQLPLELSSDLVQVLVALVSVVDLLKPVFYALLAFQPEAMILQELDWNRWSVLKAVLRSVV
jgi:hypothetical protein